jgi:hypothetical protein
MRARRLPASEQRSLLEPTPVPPAVVEAHSLEEALREEEHESTGLTPNHVRYLRDVRDGLYGLWIGGGYGWIDSGTMVEQDCDPTRRDLVTIEAGKRVLTDKGREALALVDGDWPVEEWRAVMLAERSGR